MFQLVVAVISIALIAFLALTSLYYGGDAFQSSSLRAGVTTLINAGQQISGAAIIYKTDTGGIAAASVAELVAPTLVDNMTYLSSAPGGSAFTGNNAWAIDATAKFVTIAIDVPGTTEEICTEVSRQAGNSGQFFCGDAAGAAGTTHFVYGLGTNGGGSNPNPPVGGGGNGPPVNPEPPVPGESALYGSDFIRMWISHYNGFNSAAAEELHTGAPLTVSVDKGARLFACDLSVCDPYNLIEGDFTASTVTLQDGDVLVVGFRGNHQGNSYEWPTFDSFTITSGGAVVTVWDAVFSTPIG